MIRVLAFLALCSVAHAHSAPLTNVVVDRNAYSSSIEISMPASELAHVNVTTAADVARYLPLHLSSNREMRFGPVTAKMIDEHPYWVTTVRFDHPLDEAPDTELVVYDDAITHEIRNHYIAVHEGPTTTVKQYPQRLIIGTPIPFRGSRTWAPYAAGLIALLGVIWVIQQRQSTAR